MVMNGHVDFSSHPAVFSIPSAAPIGTVTALSGTAAPSCQVCPGRNPLWEIRAGQIIHDEEARQAYLEEGTPLRPSGAVDLGSAFHRPTLRA